MKMIDAKQLTPEQQQKLAAAALKARAPLRNSGQNFAGSPDVGVNINAVNGSYFIGGVTAHEDHRSTWRQARV